MGMHKPRTTHKKVYPTLQAHIIQTFIKNNLYIKKASHFTFGGTYIHAYYI
jgi:hypothetical protein